MNVKALENELELFQKQVGKPVGIRLVAGDFSYPLAKVVSLLHLKPEELPRSILHGNLARKIRATRRKGVRVERQGREGLKDFMGIYEKRLHQLGSANLPAKFFEALLQTYPDRSLDAEAMIHTAHYKEKCVGAAFSLRLGNWFENGWFATDISDPSLYLAYALHDAMIREAVAAGANVYSFGRSTPGSGVHGFKQQWGTTGLPVVIHHIPPARHDLRQFPWLHDIWKNIPLPIARPFNPYISKWFY